VSDASLREAEIRPDELMAEQARRYQRDVEWLLSRRDEFMEANCPACDRSDPEPAWRKFDLDYVRCRDCETVYMNPRPSPGLLGEYYRRSENYDYWNKVVFPASENARKAKIFRPRAERIAAIAESHGVARGVLVDVGAGFGTFCEEVLALRGFERVLAVEPEPHLAETCRRKGLEVIQAPVEEAELPVERVDVATNFEVIEHLFSPREFVARCAALLPRGGLFVVTCPNVKGFDIVVLGALANAVDTEHLNYMHPRSLGSLLEEEGFEVLESETPGRLDAELVRKKALAGEVDLSGHPFLEQVLIEEWDRVGGAFQDFLAASGLSSNMWLVGRRK
jgi:2-polyprenyl-3-methyl-5-hydroxy-6-metoxy-1,4-benzoquinol methylase/Zn ribbon nucleic-acid-binding protein